MLANSIGRMGENLQVLFFPARNEKGEPLTNPKQPGDFSIVLKEIVGEPESIFAWRLPLTSLSPPRCCPFGGERVKADWNFCPWHGVRLDPDDCPESR